MKRGILVGICIIIAFAYLFGQKLSNDETAVAIGAFCGISASIPVSIGLIIAATHQCQPGARLNAHGEGNGEGEQC